MWRVGTCVNLRNTAEPWHKGVSTQLHNYPIISQLVSVIVGMLCLDISLHSNIVSVMISRAGATLGTLGSGSGPHLSISTHATICSHGQHLINTWGDQHYYQIYQRSVINRNHVSKVDISVSDFYSFEETRQDLSYPKIVGVVAKNFFDVHRLKQYLCLIG